MIISPSVLSADFANLQRDIEMLNISKADWIHVDIMDGVFVPNISFGLPVCEAIRKHAKKPLDIHLMIVQPERYVNAFAQAGATHITVHLEACQHLHRIVEQIKSEGCKAGVAINPHTPAIMLKDIIPFVDLILVMSVNPGFGGQKFIHTTIRKIEEVRALAMEFNPNCLIEVDGGVNASNATIIKNAGADALVAGNFVFSSSDPVGEIQKLKAI